MNDETKKVDNGGPAFPLADDRDISHGMSLRDWFAGQSLAAKISDAEVWNDKARADASNTRITHIDVAEACYLYADAMLKVRKEQLP